MVCVGFVRREGCCLGRELGVVGFELVLAAGFILRSLAVTKAVMGRTAQ